MATISRKSREQKINEAKKLLKELKYDPKQCNDVAGYTLLSLLNLTLSQNWINVSAPLMGITPIIQFIKKEYGIAYAPNTRETIRDEAVKHFLEYGMLAKNPDNPKRPPNSGNTVYQIEPNALALIKSYGSNQWEKNLENYLKSVESIIKELARSRKLSKIPVIMPNGKKVALSPGGQNPLIKEVIEEFCSRYLPGQTILYIGDAENKFDNFDTRLLEKLGVKIPPPSKMPDVIVYDKKRNWLLLIEAVISAGSIDGKRRKELKDLFKGCKAGLVFVTAFPNKETMRKFISLVSWETEVWIADDPDHIIHFNGERFLGPYPDVLPK